MPYTVRISTDTPACFVFLVDQSKSMADASTNGGPSLAESVANAVNRVIYNLVLKSVRVSDVKDRFHVSIIRYSNEVGPGFGGSLANDWIVPVSRLSKEPLRLVELTEKTPTGQERKTKKPVWIDPVASGKTAMCAAIEAARGVAEHFTNHYPGCYPPIVLNVTDGKPSDGDPREAARALRSVSSADGNTLLFNLHMTATPSQPMLYPSAIPDDSEKYAKLLFLMSSILPDSMFEFAKIQGYPVQPNARGFAYNADPSGVVQFLDIGTATEMGNVKR
jgi:hypothetical protein